MVNFTKNKYFRFAIVTILYILFIIWLGNYWYLFGIPVIFDMYITKKVNWTFWKKREGENSTIIEWIDALIFAVIAVSLINIYIFQNYKIPTPSMESTMMVGDHLYVSKVAYGPRVPITPIAFPFAHNRLLGKEPYLKWIQLDYKRLKGFAKVKRNDIVVFNFPAGDTVALEESANSYYNIVRRYAISKYIHDKDRGFQKLPYSDYEKEARDEVLSRYSIVVRPLDKKDNYIKRCVGVPGDSIEVIHGELYVNGKPQEKFKGIQYEYQVKTNGRPLNPKKLEDFDIPRAELGVENNPNYTITLTEEKALRLRDEIKDIVSVKRIEYIDADLTLFPHFEEPKWSNDNYGPLWIPKKGVTIEINKGNLPIYAQIINNYEHNDLSVNGNDIYINGEKADTYTFKMDYYWMMGDNRHHSADSRSWGYVPEDHIVGKPKFIWLSVDKEKDFLGKIRIKRMFKKIDETE